MSSKKLPCIQHREGKCTRGNNCIFSHDNDTIKQPSTTASISSNSLHRLVVMDQHQQNLPHFLTL